MCPLILCVRYRWQALDTTRLFLHSSKLPVEGRRHSWAERRTKPGAEPLARTMDRWTVQGCIISSVPHRQLAAAAGPGGLGSLRPVVDDQAGLVRVAATRGSVVCARPECCGKMFKRRDETEAKGGGWREGRRRSHAAVGCSVRTDHRDPGRPEGLRRGQPAIGMAATKSSWQRHTACLDC